MANIPEETDIALRLGSRNPIPDPHPNRPFTAEELRRVATHEAYQRSVLSGFTIQELDQCGAWSTDDAIPSDLELPIHPIWGRPMWCCERADDIGNGLSGTWDVVANDELWNALKPSLRIATLLITHSGLLPWLDALMLNDWKPVPASAVPDSCQANSTVYNTYSIHTRSPAVASKSASALRTSIETIRRGFLALEVNPTINSKSAFAWGFTTRFPQIRDGKKAYGGSLISLSTEMVFPLLMQDLTVSERLVQQFGVAKTLTHETTFFEDDAISELGNSWEVFMFGALTMPLRREANLQRPFLALGTMDWPNWLYYGNGRHERTQPERYKYTSQFNPGKAKDRYDLFPIRLTYIQDIQQRSFWEKVVPALGRAALRPLQILGNTAVTSGATIRKYGSDWYRWIDPDTLEAAGVAALQVGESSAAEWVYAQDIRNRASAIQIALLLQYERKEEEKEEQLEQQALEQRLEQRAKRNAKAREGEAEEIKLLDHALQVYDPENENKCVQIYESLMNSKFATVRAECLFCLSDKDSYLHSTGYTKGDLRRLAIPVSRLFERDQTASDRLDLVLKILGDRKDAYTLAKEQREEQGAGNKVAGGNTQEQFSEGMDIDDDGELIEQDCVIVEEWAKVY